MAPCRLCRPASSPHRGAPSLISPLAGGETSWFGFASAIAETLKAQGKPCARLEPIPSSAYPTPAQRPLNSRLDGSKLRRDWDVALPDWRQGLEACLRHPR